MCSVLRSAPGGLSDSSTSRTPFSMALFSKRSICSNPRLHYFLHITVTYHSDFVHLNQTKYALDVLQKINMLDCKPISTTISYVVQHVSQFLSSPIYVHHEAVKRILRYLKGTLGHGLPIRRSTDSSFLVAYSDAD